MDIQSRAFDCFCSTNTPTNGFYTLSLHDALPISMHSRAIETCWNAEIVHSCPSTVFAPRSEEHTSELQSLRHLVCRLLLEKKKFEQLSSAHTEPGLVVSGGISL